MTAPLPRGFVLLHEAPDVSPFLVPAARAVVTINRVSERARVAILGEIDEDQCIASREVVETFAEVQAALVRALGAQEAAP
jgi:hypothetical protein